MRGVYDRRSAPHIPTERMLRDAEPMEPDRSPSHDATARFEAELEAERERCQAGHFNPNIDYEALIFAEDELYDPSAT